MRKVLFLAVLAVASTIPISADDTQFAVGGGFVDNEADVDESSSDIEGDGLFGVFRAVHKNGLLFSAALSFTDADESEVVDVGFGPMSVTTEDELTRLGATVGYMFRRDKTVRPFLHGGLSWVQVQEQFEDVETVDDSSIAPVLGVGLEAGKGHHAFYSNVSFDFGHGVDVEVQGFSFGEAEFDLRELHLGYVYVF